MFTQMYHEKFIRFPQGKTKAVTFSYDDGVSADVRLVEILNKNHLKGTFNLNTQLFDAQEWHGRMDLNGVLKTFKGSVHEVALHGARHLFLNKVSTPEGVRELVLNRLQLEEAFGAIVQGLAYAYDARTAEICALLPALGVVYARTTEDTHTFNIPSDFLLWNPTVHHRSPEFRGLAEQFFRIDPTAELKHREGKLFYLWGHSYEFEEDGNWELIESFAERAGHAAEIWSATNIEIYRYVTAYRSLVFSMDGERAYNPSAIPVWLEVRGKIYKVEPGQTVAFDK